MKNVGQSVHAGIEPDVEIQWRKPSIFLPSCTTCTSDIEPETKVAMEEDQVINLKVSQTNRLLIVYHLRSRVAFAPQHVQSDALAFHDPDGLFQICGAQR